jgi:hypothetical protein
MTEHILVDLCRLTPSPDGLIEAVTEKSAILTDMQDAGLAVGRYAKGWPYPNNNGINKGKQDD